MTEPTPKRKSEREVLPEPVATRVLARAIELDNIRSAGTSVSDLRSAAAEVGVSAGAFDAALAEAGDRANAPVPAVRSKPSRRFRRLAAALVGLIVASMMTWFVQRTPARLDAVRSTRLVEETIVLRCLSPDEAAALIRPLLLLPENTIVARPNQASRVLTVWATPAQLQQVKSLLDEQQSADSPACAVPLIPPGTR